MTTITTRAGKGSALTYEEADANFTNLKTDVESLQGNITAANAAIVSANTAMKGYVDAQDTAVTSAWTSNAGAQADQITGANAAIVTANTAVKNYVDGQITVTQSWVTGANAAIVTANTALKGYVDAQITTTQSWVTGANAAIVTANTAMKSYVDTQDSAITTAWTSNAGVQADAIAGANAAIVTANTALKAYTDAQITTTQSWVTGANASIVTANTALKGYVDAQITNLTNGAPAILDTLGEIATSLGNNASLSTTLLNSIAGANAAIVTANTAMKSYVDAGNTTMTSYVGNQVTVANTALKAYVDAQDASVTSAWTSNAGVQADAITALQSNAGAQADQITGANVNIARIDANLGSFQTYANLTFGTSSYANANVASYLPVYGGTIYALNITGVPGQDITLEPDGTGDVSLNADTIKIGDNNVDVTITTRGNGNLLLRTHHADTTEGNITLMHGANGNIKLWPNGTGVVESAKAIVVQGNVSATYLLGDGSKLTGIPATYGNTQVAAYLPTYSGSLAASSDIIALYANAGAQSDQITGANVAITTANTALKSYVDAQDTAITSAWTANAATQQGQIDAKVNTASLALVATTGSYSDLINTPTLYSDTNTAAYLAGSITVGNIASTSGYFWANGTAYSTGTSFTGNLVTNSLTASGTGRILANASPQANVQQISSYTQGVVVTATPSYTGANLNSANQTVVMATSGNVNLLTSFAAGTRTTIGTMAYLGVTATSANITMNSADRIRPLVAGLDLNLNGKNWGTMSSASNTLVPILVNGQTLNVYNTGQMGHVVALGAGITITPVGGSINAQYATSNFPSINYSTAGTTYTASNIQYARLYTGTISGTANLTVANAIALHTFTNWATGNVTLVPNAYAILNEDTRTVIQTAGNINVNGNSASTGFIKFAVFTVAQITAVTGSAGQQAAVSDGTGKNNGAMCYWDVTNVRWSWVSDDTAVT